MKIKRFVAKDMRSALTEVKEFLGPDAIILSNKKVPEGVEIVAAIDNETAPVQAASKPVLKRAEPRFQATVSDDDDTESAGDSLQALLARQMQKQHNDGSANSANGATAQPAAAFNRPAQASRQNSLERQNGYDRPSSPERQSGFERQNTGNAQAAANSQLTEISKLQQQQASLMQKQMDSMRNEMLSMRQLLQHQVSGLMWQDLARREPVRALVIENLQQLGLTEQMADQLACFMSEDMNANDAWDSALELLAGQISTTNDDILRRGGVVALVGPTGVGKTTTVAKLAAEFARRHGADQVALITTDCYRIGAYEQLATFGRIIGCPVKLAKDSEELTLLINQLQQRKLILIDTAGMSQRDVRLAEKLATLVHNSHVKIKSYLVLSATAQARVMQESVTHFKRIPLSGCIFTKLDECLSLGEVINVAIQNSLAVSYLTNGQRVPEDIAVADAKALVQQAETLRLAQSSTVHQWYNDEMNRAEGTYA
ncbi:flagellar biosynthesis protein FlhF [Rheinheimera salexigens]|uniref:Flagellar biosynthesis protein FlhF n=1 Tax=Rheinheimera salexigens TaxID=1628148 RepID=A0A1E7Q829_9GAMM|nr:flagellar biosynthesis protein FlhF [Rheinheimera salexigens]OEY70270.1 flagellar biosynthesis protein FlhF [Rheinheimera salexigens]